MPSAATVRTAREDLAERSCSRAAQRYYRTAQSASKLRLRCRPAKLGARVVPITNLGPGLNEVGPAANYAEMTAFQKWVGVAAMLIGRLELFTVFVLFTPAFWRK
jgi:hypothetical protein